MTVNKVEVLNINNNTIAIGLHLYYVRKPGCSTTCVIAWFTDSCVDRAKYWYYAVLHTKQFYKLNPQLVATLVHVWNITIHYTIERLTLLLTLYFLVPGVTVSVTVAVPLPAAFVA